MAFATVEDVEVDFGPVPDDQHDKTDTLLDRAEVRIRQEIPDLESRITDGRLNETLLVQVEAEMVAAVLRNPRCWRSQTDTVGPFGQTRVVNPDAASGLLDLTGRQRTLLGIRKRAGSVAPTIGWDPASPPVGIADYHRPPVQPPGWWWP